MLTSADTGFSGFIDFQEFTDKWMRRFAASATATEPELTALDQQVGDGDFGANLVAGLQAMQRLMGERGAPGLDAAASAFLDEVGGTSGPLFGLLFQEVAAAASGVEIGAGEPAAALAAGIGNGLAAIQRVGEAAVGDKTLVDALAPASAALGRQAAVAPRDAVAGLAAAADAAWGGVHLTARLTARRGRASYLGERAAGVPDPGAVGVALLFTSANSSLATLRHYLSGS
jgi:dihydroxyacetone kinase-like protein